MSNSLRRSLCNCHFKLSLYSLTAFILASFFQPAKADGWADKITIGGDFRYRHEYIDAEASSGQTDKANHRHRMRARLKVDGQVKDNLKTVFQLASGNSTTPEIASTNATFDGAYAKKSFYLDMAYFEWAPRESTQILAGKVKNTLFAPGDSDLLFDTDVTFEGVTVNWQCQCENGGGYFANLGGYWFDEVDAESQTPRTDIMQSAAQIGATVPIGATKLTAGVGYHSFSPIEGRTVIGTGGGNSVELNAGVTTYATNFELTEAFLVYDGKIGDQALQFYGNYVMNNGTNAYNDAYLVGLTFGKAKARGDWSVGYNYRVLEQDALVAALIDADFAGGTTDSRGHKINVKYQVMNAVQGGLTYILAKKNINGPGDMTDYDRGQLDLVVKF